jgi:serine phosphatase RsbU (regulator of sigma subunit)
VTRWIVLITLAIVLSGCGGGDYSSDNTIKLDKWDYVVSDSVDVSSNLQQLSYSHGQLHWQSLEKLSLSDVSPEGSIWLRADMPRTSFEYPTLVLRNSNISFDCIADDSLVFTKNAPESGDQLHRPSWYFISLPVNSNNSMLYLRYQVSNSFRVPDVAVIVERGGESGVQASVARRGLPKFFGTVILEAIGLCLIAIAIIRWRSHHWILLLVGIIAFVVGFEKMLISSIYLGLFGPPSGLVLWLRSMYIPFVFALLTYTTLKIVGPGLIKSIQTLLILLMVYTVLTPIIVVMNNNPMILGKVHAIAAAITALVIVINLVGIESKGIKEFTVLRIGFGLSLLFILHDRLVFLSVLPWNVDLGLIGTYILVGTLFYVAIAQSIRLEEQLMSVKAEIKAAKTIQLSILPEENPDSEAFDIAAEYIPMTGVAGDFYDFLMIDDHRIGILVADVSGHGIPAALIASMVKIAFAAQLPHVADPAMVMQGINDSLCGKIKDQFVTAGYAYIDIEKNILRYAGAGHPPLLLHRRSQSQVRELEKNGLIIGPFPEAEYSNIQTDLEDGDTLIMYTDGITEAESDSGKQFGVEGLKQFIVSSRRLQATEVVKGVLEKVQSWTGRRKDKAADDDLTLVVARICSKSKH